MSKPDVNNNNGNGGDGGNNAAAPGGGSGGDAGNLALPLSGGDSGGDGGSGSGIAGGSGGGSPAGVAGNPGIEPGEGSIGTPAAPQRNKGGRPRKDGLPAGSPRGDNRADGGGTGSGTGDGGDGINRIFVDDPSAGTGNRQESGTPAGRVASPNRVAAPKPVKGGGKPGKPAPGTQAMIETWLTVGSGYLTEVRGPHWKLTPAQVSQVAEPAARCWSYLPVPEISEPMQAALALGLAVVAVLGPPAVREYQLWQQDEADKHAARVAAMQNTGMGNIASEGSVPDAPKPFSFDSITP